MTQQAERSVPNVIWIFGDQHRAQALGCNGDPNLATPNLDRLAAEGLNLTAAVGGFPLCCPFRGSLLSGRYPQHCVPGHEYRMPPDTPTIATTLRENGYHTAYFGKWHVDGFKERNGRAAFHIVPPGRRGGFDEWVGYENNNAQWDCWVHGGSGEDAFHTRLPGYETDALSDMLIDYIDARGRDLAAGQGKPFFAALSVQPPHDPYVAPEEWMRRHTPAGVELRANVPDVAPVLHRCRRELAGYYAMIENLDWNVGRIRDALEAAGLIDNTHILFFSDHGDMHGSHGQFRKTSPWEESVRIPFIMGGASRSRYGHGGGEQAVPINHVDIAPTTLGLCGIDAPEAMQGTDYSGLWRRDRSVVDAPDSAYIQSVIPTRHGDSIDRAWRGVVTTDGWKYVAFEHQPWLLFNLNDDPYERVNRAYNSRYAAERKRLNERVRQWMADTDDDFALPDL